MFRLAEGLDTQFDDVLYYKVDLKEVPDLGGEIGGEEPPVCLLMKYWGQVELLRRPATDVLQEEINRWRLESTMFEGAHDAEESHDAEE